MFSLGRYSRLPVAREHTLFMGDQVSGRFERCDHAQGLNI